MLQRAKSNEVEGIERIGAARLSSLEPQIHGSSALLSPCTGIVDSHALMLSYQADADAAGGTTVFRTPVVAAAIAGRKIQLRTGGSEAAELEADLVVNAAGLDAWEFSAGLSGLDRATIPPKYLAKGNYFTLTGTRAPFRHLIYPVPEPGGLGIHLTLDLAGQARFGPDVEWVDRIDYAVDPKRGERFYAAIRRYWPGLPDGVLTAAYSGIRPKTAADGAKRFRHPRARRIRDIRATYRCTALSLQGSPRLSPSASTWPSLPGSPRETAPETVPWRGPCARANPSG